MNPLQEMVLIGEIVLQSKIARRAAERLESPDSDVDIWSSEVSVKGEALEMKFVQMKKLE